MADHASSLDSFGTISKLKVGRNEYAFFRLDQLTKSKLADPSHLPFSLKILLENLLRREDGRHVKPEDIEALAHWNPKEKPVKEIAFTPARVLLQDFTGVPAVVDLAAMRDAVKKMGSDPKRINPLLPVDLVIDHSIQVDAFGSPKAFEENSKLEFERNQERYQFLRWGQQAFQNFRVVPPATGIVHQVNLEYLAQVVCTTPLLTSPRTGGILAFPDTLIGADSHTTMINALGVIGWGVGGIEAEAAMLGQPVSMLIPEVVGFKLKGELPEGATATDAVLTVTHMLRKKGVVGKFVEFYGAGLDSLSLPDRATIANMCPEYGATIGFFPVDEETLAYLKLTGRSEETISLVEAYTKEQGLFRSASSPEPMFSDSLELDLGAVVPCLAGPKRPQDLVPLQEVKGHGSGQVVIAAITSCTNTSNPAVMIAAGLLAKKAVERGLSVKPRVKTSLAPGSKVVMDYLRETKLMEPLERLKFHLVGFGCTTCIGNSGPLADEAAESIQKNDVTAAAVLSGNRNFEGRIHPLVRANYLASPPLVVAYAIAGSMNVDLTREPLGSDRSGKPVYLGDLWPSQREIREAMKSVTAHMFRKQYASVFEGDERWKKIQVPSGETFRWNSKSTYIKNPPFFVKGGGALGGQGDIRGARVLVMLGDSVTTDHISPAGSIAKDSPAGKYLMEQGVDPKDFNSYGARRGNFEVMMRGTFANVRLKNLLVPGTEGGWTHDFILKYKISIFDAAMNYKSQGIPLIVLAGKEYGSGSSRDWAAKGPALLGVRAVIAESFERIHRSNLIGMGILPLEFEAGETRQSLGLTGEELFNIEGISGGLQPKCKLNVSARGKSGEKKCSVVCRIDTPAELSYFQHGGILPYVLSK